MQKTLATLLN